MNFPRIRCRFASSTSLMLAACVIAAAAASDCVQDPKDAPPDQRVETKGNARLKPEYDASGTLRKIEYDRNNDGKVDAWGYMDGSRVVRVETDENGDGQVDRWEFHRETPAVQASSQTGDPVDRTIERIELSTRFDGRVSRKEYFTNGVLAKVEEDTNGDGKMDKWETYRDGSLSQLELDTKGRGTPDRRLIYRPDGAFDHIETDPTGSGTFTRLQQ
jgi:hypothetical protein